MPSKPVRLVLAAVTALLIAMPGLRADPEPASDQMVAQKGAALTQSSAIIGNRAVNARGHVAIIEFFDYTCPYCKAVEPRLEALLKADRNVTLVLKEFPILTPQSMVATRAALAAVKQGKYAPFHQALMNYAGPLDEAVIFDTAKAVGLNLTRLRADMKAPEIADEIIANFNLARSLRLFQTPSFIVGHHIVTGPSADIDFRKEVAAARR